MKRFTTGKCQVENEISFMLLQDITVYYYETVVFVRPGGHFGFGGSRAPTSPACQRHPGHRVGIGRLRYNAHKNIL